MRGHADRNASLVIGKRLVARYQTPQEEKPPAPLPAERESKDSGVEDSHEPKTEAVGHSSLSERHGILNEHGTAQERTGMDGCSLSDMPPTLRRSPSWGQAPSTPASDYRGVSEAAGLEPLRSVTGPVRPPMMIDKV
jgi:hypothetical protein